MVKPGVYEVSADSRVNDAVVAAGGLSADADRGRVNLAAKIVDGQKVFIPKVGEASSFAEAGTLGASTALINVNSASQAELEKLPGIGPVTAQKIINLRPYNGVSELLSKKAVSTSVYDKIKDLVTF